MGFKAGVHYFCAGVNAALAMLWGYRAYRAVPDERLFCVGAFLCMLTMFALNAMAACGYVRAEREGQSHG